MYIINICIRIYRQILDFVATLFENGGNAQSLPLSFLSDMVLWKLKLTEAQFLYEIPTHT